MSSAERQWEPSSRVWHAPPPVGPLAGSWALRGSVVVLDGRSHVAFSVSKFSGRPMAHDVQVWRSRHLEVERPATYTEAIPLLTSALWELDMAFRGMRISFE